MHLGGGGCNCTDFYENNTHTKCVMLVTKQLFVAVDFHRGRGGGGNQTNINNVGLVTNIIN